MRRYQVIFIRLTWWDCNAMAWIPGIFLFIFLANQMFVTLLHIFGASHSKQLVKFINGIDKFLNDAKYFQTNKNELFIVNGVKSICENVHIFGSHPINYFIIGWAFGSKFYILYSIFIMHFAYIHTKNKELKTEKIDVFSWRLLVCYRNCIEKKTKILLHLSIRMYHFLLFFNFLCTDIQKLSDIRTVYSYSAFIYLHKNDILSGKCLSRTSKRKLLTYQSNKMLMFVSHKKRLHTDRQPPDLPKKSLLLISVSST